MPISAAAAPAAAPVHRALVEADRVLQSAADDDDSGCETPLGPRFAAALDSSAAPCDELTEMLR